MSTETTKKKIKFDNGTNFARAYTDKAIDAKLPTDLKATATTNLETLISTFAGTTTAGFGDYILLTVDTTAKLTKQDGTETDLSTLTVTISDTVK